MYEKEGCVPDVLMFVSLEQKDLHPTQLSVFEDVVVPSGGWLYVVLA